MKKNELSLIIFVLITNFSVASAAPKEPVTSKALNSTDTVLEAVQDIELQKPLDLSVPFKMDFDTNMSIHSKSQEARNDSKLFAGPGNLKSRSVQLDGRVLMTQEQEIGKVKTVDGAGIVINVQR